MSAPDDLTTPGVLGEIMRERFRAHAKHGASSMESCDMFADRRYRVLGEEFGEVAQVLNDREIALVAGGHAGPINEVAQRRLRAELVQVAAMAYAWIKALDGEALA